MRLDLLAAAINDEIQYVRSNHAILIYGGSKTGKTRLVGTSATVPEIKRIFWFDLENGSETLLHMGLTQEQLAKIQLIRLPDTRENPVGVNTILQAFSFKVPTFICDEHGVPNCIQCKGKSGVMFNLGSLTHDDLVVIDSGSQLGDSALNKACEGMSVDFKPGYDEWGKQGKYLTDIFSIVQQGTHTNYVVITHELIMEEEVNGVKRDKIVPLCGTRTFSSKLPKYFGTVVNTGIALSKHVAGSSSTYKSDRTTGSRRGIVLEKAKELSMREILITGGIIKENKPKT